MGVEKSNTFNPKTFSDWSVTFVNQHGVEADITDIIVQLSIFESLFNNCMFGTMKLKDAVGWSERNAVVGGEEQLKIEITTPTLPDGLRTSNLEKVFTVNSYGPATAVTDGTGTVFTDIGFVSPFLITSNQTRINRSFHDMTADKIVEFIAFEVLKIGIDVENDWANLQTNTEAKHQKNIVVPGWNPLKTINFITENAISKETESSNYLFYENNDGFHFTTIDALKEKPIMRNLAMSGATPAEDSVKADGGLGVSQGHIVENMVQISRFNHTKSQMNGLYGAHIVTNNIITKQIKTYEVDYDGWEESTLGMSPLNGQGLFDTAPITVKGYMSDNYMYEVHDKTELSHYPHRQMKMSELATLTVQFDMPGDSNIWAGDIVNIDMPTKIRENPDSDVDVYVSGEWMITAIHHKINKAEYVMTCEAMKDGYENDA